MTTSEAFRKPAFFNEFVCCQEWGDSLGIGLLRGPHTSGHLILHRSPEAVWVEPKEWQLLKSLAPHLARAADIHSLLARSRATANALAAATGFAVFLLSGTCRVLFANREGEELIRAQMGLRYENGRLVAATPVLTGRLQAVARAGSRPRRAGGETGGCRLCRRSRRRAARPYRAICRKIWADPCRGPPSWRDHRGQGASRRCRTTQFTEAAAPATQTAFLRKPEPRARRNSSGGFLRPPWRARRLISGKLFLLASKVPLMLGPLRGAIAWLPGALGSISSLIQIEWRPRCQRSPGWQREASSRTLFRAASKIPLTPGPRNVVLCPHQVPGKNCALLIFANNWTWRRLAGWEAAMKGEAGLIALIYDAVIDPFRWGEAVKRIVEETKSMSGNLVFQQPGAGSLTALHNVDPCFAEAYAESYHKADPLLTPEWGIGPGEVRFCSYTQTESFKASAYYHEFVRPQGWSGLVVTGLARTPQSFALLALTRSPGAVEVEPPEWHLLEILAPHLARAAAIQRLLARSRATTNALAAATSFAIFLLSETCRVLYANREAEDLVRAKMGLHYERGRLVATTPALTRRLQALARAGACGRAEAATGGMIELNRGEERPPLHAHVIPLAASRAASVFDFDRPAAAVFVADPTAGMLGQVARFAGRFGLTIAEKRVLGEIVGGSGIVAAATKLKISEMTARSHANRIFAKTGTTRQTELIRRFFETALPGAPSA